MKINKKINSEKEMIFLGEKLGKYLPNGINILLGGDLGAGKTTLVRGIAKGLNIKEIIQSPTFNIMKLYLKGDRPLIHIDAYRLKDHNIDIGLDEYIGFEKGLTAIEWPQYISPLLYGTLLHINIKNLGDDKREIEISSDSDLLNEALQNV